MTAADRAELRRLKREWVWPELAWFGRALPGWEPRVALRRRYNNRAYLYREAVATPDGLSDLRARGWGRIEDAPDGVLLEPLPFVRVIEPPGITSTYGGVYAPVFVRLAFWYGDRSLVEARAFYALSEATRREDVPSLFRLSGWPAVKALLDATVTP